MIFFLALKQNLLEKAFSSVNTKTNPNVAVKHYWKEQPFIFTVYLTNYIFQTSVLLESKQNFLLFGE